MHISVISGKREIVGLLVVGAVVGMTMSAKADERQSSEKSDLTFEYVAVRMEPNIVTAVGYQQARDRQSEADKTAEQLNRDQQTIYDDYLQLTKDERKTVFTKLQELEKDDRQVVLKKLLGPKLRVFQPKARIYFDTGDDDEGELDIFEDGSLQPAVNLVEIYWAMNYDILGTGEKSLGKQMTDLGWTWGPSLGFGLSTPAQDSENGDRKASGAPVLLISAGLVAEFPLGTADSNNTDITKNATKLGIEFGYAMGFSADEGLSDIDDGAIYVGLNLHIPF